MSTTGWIFLGAIIFFAGLMIYVQKKKGTGSKGFGAETEAQHEQKGKEGDQAY